jgi:hypothetical protein
MSNPLDPEMMSPAERLEEAACLLARGILQRRLRAADGRQKPLDVPRQPRDECVEPQSEGRDT